MSMLVTDVIAAVKRRSSMPTTNAQGFTDTDILAWIVDELDSTCYPQIVDMVEDFFITKKTIPLRDPNNLPYYSNRIVPLPSRCFGWQVRELKYRDTGNNTYNIPQISLEDDETATLRSLRATGGNFVPGFYITNDSFKLIHETTNLTGFLDITYVIKPSALSISTSLCADITSLTKTDAVTDVSSSPIIYPADTTIYIGKAQNGGASTITLDALVVQASQTYFNGMTIYIVSGTGATQTAYVTTTGNNWDNTTKILTVSAAWTTPPDATSLYHISTSLALSNDTKFSIASVGTDLVAYCADGAAALFDIYKKSSGALVATDVWMMRHSTSFYTASLTANDAQEIMNNQQGGFTATGITSGYSSELVLCPAGQNVYTPLPKEADQLLIACVVGRYLESLGDTEGLGVVKAQQTDIRKNISKILGRRMIGESKVFVNRRGWARYFAGNRFGSW